MAKQEQYWTVKRDANHNEIVRAIKKLTYCSVIDLASVGKGCPDILVGIEGHTETFNILMEIKSINGKLRPDQEKFMQKWKGKKCVVRSVYDAIYICEHYHKR